MQCNYNSFIQIINFHRLFRNARRCRKTGACRILVPLQYTCVDKYQVNEHPLWASKTLLEFSNHLSPKNWSSKCDINYQICFTNEITSKMTVLRAISVNFLTSAAGKYRKSTSIRHFEQRNQQLSNLIDQNCDGSTNILLDVGNQQHAV